MEETRRETAARLFHEGYNCAQSVFAAYADLYGLDRETALRLSAGLGAGMGRMREVCGCCTGMFLLSGLACSAKDGADTEGKTENYRLVRELADAFRQRAGGSILCRELLGLERAEDDCRPAERTGEYYRKRPCPELVELACSIVEESLLPRIPPAGAKEAGA